jgi:hypothetical protein
MFYSDFSKMSLEITIQTVMYTNIQRILYSCIYKALI